MRKDLKILVPIDFSKYSQQVLKFSLSLKEHFDPAYTLIHVLPSGGVETFADWGEESAESLKQRKEEVSAELRREVQRCRDEVSDLRMEYQVASGVPFKEICRFADEGNFHLIVIGTHGRTGLSHLLIGSTAERVVQHAACPVLSIKPQVL